MAFQQRCNNDDLKRQWCKKYQVQLIEIPYTDYSKEYISSYLTELINRKSE